MKSIQIQIRNVYGNETIYPICSQAKLFARLAGTKTLTQSALLLIQELGYTVQTVPVLTGIKTSSGKLEQLTFC